MDFIFYLNYHLFLELSFVLKKNLIVMITTALSCDD